MKRQKIIHLKNVLAEILLIQECKHFLETSARKRKTDVNRGTDTFLTPGGVIRSVTEQRAGAWGTLTSIMVQPSLTQPLLFTASVLIRGMDLLTCCKALCE